MTDESILLIAIGIPLAASFLIPLIGILSSKIRNGAALFFVLTAVTANAFLVPAILAGRSPALAWSLPLGLNLSFAADGLAVFMALVSSTISAVIVFYSFGYIKHEKNQNEYYLMVTLFLGGMMGICYAQNLILLYVFWEITGLTSWRLIGFFRKKEHVIRADKAFLVTVFGALLMLIGFIMLGQDTGSFNMDAVKSAQAAHPVSKICVALILAGILSKSATLPFHSWLPDAGVAPSPVTALLHAAVLVKIGVYIYARLFIVIMPLDEFWHTAIPVIAAASTFVSAGAALIENNIKRIIAYSTISQIGFIFFGLSTGSDLGIAGGVLFILMHGIAKAGLFLSAGIIEHGMNTKDITQMGGLYRTMPITAVSFLLCSFSVMGIPPFGGFFSKYMVIAGAIKSGQPLMAGVFLFAGLFTIVYLFRLFNAVFLKAPATEPAKEGTTTMVASVAFLAVLSFLSGIFVNYPLDFVRFTVIQMLGAIK